MKRKRYLPFGYQMADGNILPHPQEAPLVQQLFHHYLEGASLNSLAKFASLQGVPYRENAAAWNKNMVGRILQDTRYSGNTLFPPLIPQATFQQAAALRKAKSEEYGGSLSSSIRPFREKLRCASCKAPLKRNHTRTGEIHWECSSCKTTSISLPDTVLIEKLVVLLNHAITHPHLICLPPEKESPISLEALRLEQEINRLMDDPYMDSNHLLRLLYTWAQAKYKVCDSGDQENATSVVLQELQQQRPLQQLDTEVLYHLCEMILISPNGAVSLVLQNGATLYTERSDSRGIQPHSP